MRKILSLFAAILFAGSMMATDLSVTIADYATAHSWVNDTKYTSLQLDENVTATVTGGGNTGKYYTSGDEWRLYQTESPTITIATTVGTISAITITYNDKNTGVLKDGETTIASGASVAVSGAEKTFSVGNSGSATNGQVKITKIEVTYAGTPSAVATPTFTPAAGTYNAAQNVTIACDTEDASIFYTVDGSTPTDASIPYTTFIALDANGTYTIKAIAKKGSDYSAVASATYKIAIPTVYNSFAALVAGAQKDELVTVNFAAIDITHIYTNSAGLRKGVYVNEEEAEGNDVEIYFSKKVNNVDVVVPDAWGVGGTIAGSITGTWTYFESGAQWELVPSADDWNWTSLTYVAPAVAAPVFAPLKESFYDEFNVTLTCATEGAKIYYTMGATWPADPSDESTEYTAPFKVSESTIVRAIAIKDGVSSAIDYQEYKKETVVTYTCAEAKTKALSVSANNEVYKEGDVEVFSVTGYVTKIQSAWSNKKISFWVDDEKGETTTIEAYNCSVANQEDAPGIGDFVRVIGKLTKYNTTPEFAAGCECIIIERDVPAVNLGAKTIAEFLALENKKDTCVLTGTVSNIAMDKDDATKFNKYGNFDLTDASGTVYVYGLLNQAGEKGKFIETGIVAGSNITIKAVYYAFEKDGQTTPQAKDAVLVSINGATAIDNNVVEGKAVKRIENGMLIIEKNGVRYNALGQAIR